MEEGAQRFQVLKHDGIRLQNPLQVWYLGPNTSMFGYLYPDMRQVPEILVPNAEAIGSLYMWLLHIWVRGPSGFVKSGGTPEKNSQRMNLWSQN